MTGRANIKDVAKVAGVSFKTVSRVINGAPNVRHDVQVRVLEAIRQLDYIPNTSARSLKAGVGDVVGIVVDNIDDPFWAELVSSVQELALQAGLDVLIASTGVDPVREQQALVRLAGHNVCGIILAPVAEHLPRVAPLSVGLPVVLVDRPREGFTSVVVDNAERSCQAVTRFIERGHRRIAFVGLDARFQTSQRRFAGYCTAHDRAGLQVAVELLPPPGMSPPSEADQVQRLLNLPEPPTAIFASHPRAAMRAAEVLHRQARTDVAFISFGDFPMADALSPACTVIHHDARAIGRQALNLLLSFDADVRQDVVVPTALIERGSGELSPVEEFLS